MRTQKEVQDWLMIHHISKKEIDDVKKWLRSCDEYDSSLVFYSSNNAKYTLQDVIDFVSSPSPQTNLNPLVAQFEKIEKEMLKMRKLMNKL